LVESSESLSKAASEADAMVKLQDGLTNATYPEPMRTRLLEGALLAIAALCAVREANRKLVWGVTIRSFGLSNILSWQLLKGALLATVALCAVCKANRKMVCTKAVALMCSGLATFGPRPLYFCSLVLVLCVVFFPLQSVCILDGAGAHIRSGTLIACFFFFGASTWRV
jgi:uncharacterized membrane protein